MLNDSFLRAEHDYLTPPEYEVETCSRCDEEASYLINDETYCQYCIDLFSSVPNENETCVGCDEEVEEGYRVNGDFYCKECFENHYRKEF